MTQRAGLRARPEFDTTITAAHRRKFDVLLVRSLNRLHRSLIGVLHTVPDLDRPRPSWRAGRLLQEAVTRPGGPVRSLLIENLMKAFDVIVSEHAIFGEVYAFII
ncbi:MAG: recombinase family protein [Labilithrix sp.]|nr:recombinase family protein [Labilithrix sp.]